MVDLGQKFAGWISGRTTNMKGVPQSTRRVKLQKGNAWRDPSRALVVELIGDVGAGKTTFTRGLAEGLGITEPVTSPSFTISKSYPLQNGGNLIHYDFYRLSNPGLMAADLQENLTNPDNIIIVEWGESISSLLPENHIKIQIEYNDDGRRVNL